MARPDSVAPHGREATTGAILDATSDLIAEKGVDGFTLSDVARRAKINRALIYHYFQNRDNLIVHALEHIFKHYEKVQPESDRRAIDESVRFPIEHPEISTFFFQMLLSGRQIAPLGDRVDRAIETLERWRQNDPAYADTDPPFLVAIVVLSGLAWSLARKEMARTLGIEVEEADERFIAQLRRSAGRRTAPPSEHARTL